MEELWAVETEVSGIRIIGSREAAEKVYEKEKIIAKRYVEMEGKFSEGLTEKVRLLEVSLRVAKELQPEVGEDGERTGFWEEIEY